MKIRFLPTLKWTKAWYYACLVWVASFAIPTQGSSQMIVTFGTGTAVSGTTTASPVNIWFRSSHHQIIYPASEIIAAGVTGAQLIDSLAWDVVGAPTYNLPNYTIKLKNTTATTAATYDGVGLTTHYNGTYAPVAGSFTNFLVFSTPFFWDGVSNILVDVCWDQVPSYSGSGTVRYTTVTNANRYVWSDGSPQCGVVTTSTTSNRTNAKMSFRPAPVCSDPPTAGTIEGVDSICPSTAFTLTMDGYTSGVSGLTYQWESSASPTGPFTDIAGANTPSYASPGITTPTYYRFSVKCGTGAEVYSAVHGVGLYDWIDCYCTPVFTYFCSGSYNVGGFETFDAVTDVVNLGTGCPAGSTGYSDYSSMMATVYRGADFGIHIVGSSGYTGYRVWIDYNRNGIFETAEMVSSTPYGPSLDIETIVSVDAGVDTGVTKMRVMAGYYSSTFDPCATLYMGEVEDYLIRIINPPNCSTITFPETITAIAAPPVLCVSGDILLNLETEIPTALGITYQWQASASPTGPFTNVGTLSGSPEQTITGVSTSRYYRCKIYCNGTEVTNSTNVYVEAVVPEVPVVNSGQHCGPGPVELTGTVGSGDIFWFDAPTEGTLIGIGDTILTPDLTATTTFYAAGGAYPPANIQVGTGTSSSSAYNAGPYNIYYRRATMQMLYTKEQILAAGGMAGTIEEIQFNCTGLPAYALPGYQISIKSVPATMTALTWQTAGFTTIFSPAAAYMPAATGWQSYPIAGGFDWDGNSGIVVQVCFSQVSPTYASSGTHQYTTTPNQMLYSRTDGAGTSCGETGTSTSSELPNVIFKFAGCSSERVPVVAYIRDTPTVDIPIEDGVYCVFNNEFTLTSTPEQPDTNTFLWSDGSTDSFTVVGPTSGVEESFWVEVTNEWGCTASDTVHLTLNPSPVVELGPDTLVCEGGIVTLDAGSTGTAYYWNTGETTPTIDVDDGGTYYVLVTNEFGCMATDTVDVTVEGFFPYVAGIIVDNLAPYTFKFTPHHPEYIVSYSWDFGDGTPVSTAVSPTHTYAAPGTYLVTMSVSSTCGTIAYTTYATMFTGIDENDMSKYVQVYPNPSSHMLQIESSDGIKMDRLSVVNALGQVLRTEELKGTEKYSLDVSAYANGMYYLKIDSKEGTMIKKFQVMK